MCLLNLSRAPQVSQVSQTPGPPGWTPGRRQAGSPVVLVSLLVRLAFLWLVVYVLLQAGLGVPHPGYDRDPGPPALAERLCELGSGCARGHGSKSI